MTDQLARGLFVGFGSDTNPFDSPNGMDENLRRLDDHMGLYTLSAPQPPGTSYPLDPANGDGQIYSDGTYATFNAGTWKHYEPRRGVRAGLVGGTESWLNTGSSWEAFSVVDTEPAVAAATAAIQPLVTLATNEASRSEIARDSAFAVAAIRDSVLEGLDDATIAIGANFSVLLPDGSLQPYRKDSNSSATPIGEPVQTASQVNAVRADVNTLNQRFARAQVAVWRGSHPEVAGVLAHNPVTGRPLVYVKWNGELVYRGAVSPDTVATLADSAVGRTLSSISVLRQRAGGRYIAFQISRDFRVINGWDTLTNRPIGQGAGGQLPERTPSTPLPVGEVVPRADVVHDLVLGESLSVGARGIPVLTVAQPYANLTFTDGPRSGLGGLTSLTPLVENDLTPAPDAGVNRGETPCSAASNRVVELAAISSGIPPSANIRLGSTAGKGGAKIVEVWEGASWYGLTEAHIQAGFDLVTALAKTYAMHAVHILIGANDAGQGTTYAAFKSQLRTWRASVEATYHTKTGRNNKVKFLLQQESYRLTTNPGPALAIYDLCEEEPDNFALVSPTYHCAYASDQVHLLAPGYIKTGLLAARQRHAISTLGERPRWLRLKSAYSSGNTTTGVFDVPVKPLRFDVENLAPTTDYGFRIVDNFGPVTITGQSIVDGDKVRWTHDRPLEAGAKLRAGLDYLGSGLIVLEGASTNLRDSEDEVVIDHGIEHRLFNACPHFERDIIRIFH
ncbi:hypothetical protein [Pigmentiphaga kullae]|uniref:Uncharacterized protein n=1 Tax=Pigmentiphaga kullae TaxID=151784 RepID=A0A4Q7NLW5_9BURK|nr:hypothetical protein [Pigmentiphaga kullae]RZS86073.1 hypothetical protein EV675_2107 [Pigmentiphaga kullae]